MSFYYQARRVRDPGHPPWLRLSALRACVRSFCVLTGGSYARVSAHLGIDFLYEPGRQPPDDAFLRRTLDQVERERNRSLDRLRAVEKKRALAKARGNRQLSTADRTALRELGGDIG
ncbi:hypothetical protein [Longimicrobium sp.]|uniref:hypothetical protein n=1 Tax=Longimicrobium sp. TaxID=2029185 RepID=UPI003B3B6FFB